MRAGTQEHPTHEPLISRTTRAEVPLAGLSFTRLKTLATAHGIDSITRHPGLIMFGHHDRAAIEKLRQAAGKKGRVMRVVDQKTAVLPLHADTLADPNKLLASVRSLLELR